MMLFFQQTTYPSIISIYIFISLFISCNAQSCSSAGGQNLWARENCWATDNKNDYSSLQLHPIDTIPEYPHIRIYFHAANKVNQTIGPFIVEELMDAILNSGLMSQATGIYVSTFGTVETLKSTFAKYDKVAIIAESKNIKYYEFPTLMLMQSHAHKLHPDTKILYLHTKGSSVPTSTYKALWRKEMVRFIIDNHQVCVEALSNGCSACGLFWNSSPWTHFSGNFWWSTARHISELIDVRKIDWRWRYGAERWIESSGVDSSFYRLFNEVANISLFQNFEIDLQGKTPLCSYKM